MKPTARGLVHESTRNATDDWITPPDIIRALGKFDLDPCASINQGHRTARIQYTRADNGLVKPWFGRVWMNPPYGLGADKWLEKIAAHGRGTALIFARTDTARFHEYVFNAAHAILFVRKRIQFLKHGGELAGQPGAPSCFVAYGSDDATKLAAAGIAGAFIQLRTLDTLGEKGVE